MPETRHAFQSSIDHDLGASTGAGVLPRGFQIDTHVHADGLLVYAASGVVATVTERGTWVAPASRIIWTPPGFEHAHRFYGVTDVRVVGVPLLECGALPPEPGVFMVSPLLREALLALTDLPEARAGAHERLRAVVVDELVEAPDRSIRLPVPQDDRLREVTVILHADPAESATLAELGRRVGASERTLSRLFDREFGMSFHQWRTVLRIHHALLYLGDGMSVTDTATTCGWANPTSFIEAFSAIVGQTPGRYQAAFVAGADGDHGISRPSIPTDAITRYTHEFGYSWLSIQAGVAAKPSGMAIHDRGFAAMIPRGSAASRLYLQIAVEDTVADWPDGRIWAEMAARFGAPMPDGPIIDKRVVPLRSAVTVPMQYGHLFLLGDAAHIVPPMSAKGMHLALHDAEVLARALVLFAREGDRSLLDSYSDDALGHIWNYQAFAAWITRLMHDAGDASYEGEFAKQIARAELQRQFLSAAANRLFSELTSGLN